MLGIIITVALMCTFAFNKSTQSSNHNFDDCKHLRATQLAPVHYPPRPLPTRDNPLWSYYATYKTGPVIHKWEHYFDIYHRHFHKFIDKKVRLLEIGVQSGGTIGMWKAYFGSQLEYYGVDINPYIKPLFDDPHNNIRIFIGSQDNKTFWSDFKSTVPVLDIIIDDGGHTMNQQRVAFVELYSLLSKEGVYMVEDCVTSYSSEFGGGFKKKGTWIEFSKDLIDDLYGHYLSWGARHGNITDSIMAILYYDQIVVFEKGKHLPFEFPMKRGSMQMAYMPPTLSNGEINVSVLADLKKLYLKD
jgi:hypothetical protein